MKSRFRKYRVIGLIFSIGVTGCANSPSILAPYSTEADSTASLTWLMFAIAGIVLLILSALLWISYQRSRAPKKEKDLYAHDRTYLRNVVLGGGVAPIVILLIVMGLGIRVENLSNIRRNKPNPGVDIEVVGHQWWWEVRYSNQNFT